MLKISKMFTGLAGFITLAIGVIMLGMTIWAFTVSALAFNNYTFLGLVLGVDLAIILASVLGIVGVKRQIGIMIFIFQLLVMVFFVFFVIIGICAYTLPKEVFKGDCNGDTKNEDIIAQAHAMYLKSNILCVKSLCKCAMTNDTYKNYAPLERALIDTLYDRTGTALKYPECSSSPTDENSTNLYSVFNAIENAFQCSGWCDNEMNLIYTFSDVNKGKPTNACFTIMKEKIVTYGGVVGIFALGSAVFMLLVCICGLFVCFSRKSEPLSSRFVVVNDNGYYRANY